MYFINESSITLYFATFLSAKKLYIESVGIIYHNVDNQTLAIVGIQISLLSESNAQPHEFPESIFASIL